MLTFTEAGLLGGSASTKINPLSGARRSEYFILYFMMYEHVCCWPEIFRQIVLCGAALRLPPNLVSQHFLSWAMPFTLFHILGFSFLSMTAADFFLCLFLSRHYIFSFHKLIFSLWPLIPGPVSHMSFNHIKNVTSVACSKVFPGNITNSVSSILLTICPDLTSELLLPENDFCSREAMAYVIDLSLKKKMCI